MRGHDEMYRERLPFGRHNFAQKLIGSIFRQPPVHGSLVIALAEAFNENGIRAIAPICPLCDFNNVLAPFGRPHLKLCRILRCEHDRFSCVGSYFFAIWIKDFIHRISGLKIWDRSDVPDLQRQGCWRVIREDNRLLTDDRVENGLRIIRYRCRSIIRTATKGTEISICKVTEGERESGESWGQTFDKLNLPKIGWEGVFPSRGVKSGEVV